MLHRGEAREGADAGREHGRFLAVPVLDHRHRVVQGGGRPAFGRRDLLELLGVHLAQHRQRGGNHRVVHREVVEHPEDRVALEGVEDRQRGEVFLEDGEAVPVARHRVHVLHELVAQLGVGGDVGHPLGRVHPLHLLHRLVHVGEHVRGGVAPVRRVRPVAAA